MSNLTESQCSFQRTKMILMISVKIAQSEDTVRMQGFNLHRLNLIKNKYNKNVQSIQETQEFRSQSNQWKMQSFIYNNWGNDK